MRVGEHKLIHSFIHSALYLCQSVNEYDRALGQCKPLINHPTATIEMRDITKCATIEYRYSVYRDSGTP